MLPADCSHKKFNQVIFIVFLVLFTSLLACFAYKGFFSRYLQDDYCYGSTILKLGFFKGVIYPYFHTTEYNGNRYSLTLFAGLAEITLGTKYQSWFAAISILCWLGSLSFLTAGVFKKFTGRYQLWLSLLTAAILLTFVFYLAPNLYHVLYWRNASLTYLAPLVVNTFLLACVFHQSEKAKVRWFHYLGIFCLSFIAAGFSEVTAVWQITVWGMILLLSNFFLRKGSETKRDNGIIFVVLAAAILGAILLIISPTNAAALNDSTVKIANPATLVTKSLRFGFDFLHYSLAGKWLPFLIVLLCGFTLKQFVQSERTTVRVWLIQCVLLVICTYLISVACMTPSVQVRTAYPDGRALLPPHFALIVAVFLLGYFTGAAFPIPVLCKGRTPLIYLTMGVLVIGLAAYSVRMAPLILSDVSPLRARAAAWDQRQALIYQEKAEGKTHLIVPAFDNIALITELHPEEGNWVNQCAAHYYQVDGISAQENYNGVKPYFK